MCCRTCMRGTLQQSSMQQQLQQHPSGEAAAVLVRLTWVLSKSFTRGQVVARRTGHVNEQLAVLISWGIGHPLWCVRSSHQLGDRPPAEPRVMSARMPLQGE